MKINTELLISELVAKFDDLAKDRGNLESNVRGIVEANSVKNNVSELNELGEHPTCQNKFQV